MTPFLKSYPMDVVKTNQGVTLYRGALSLLIRGEGAEEVVAVLLTLTDQGATRENILAEFAEPHRPRVSAVIDQLLEKRFLVIHESSPEDSPLLLAEDQTPEDLFYWHFDATTEAMRSRLSAFPVTVVGINLLSLYLIERLQRLGFTQINWIDDPLLRNARLFSPEGALEVELEGVSVIQNVAHLVAQLGEGLQPELVIAASDFGSRRQMRVWNEFCVTRQLPFLPVLLENLRGHIGPLVRGKSGACYECLRARENANLENPELMRAGELSDEDQPFNRMAFVEPLLATLSGVAAVEVLKLAGDIMLPHINQVLSISFLEPSVKCHPVLRIPRCRVCSPAQWRPEVNLSRQEFREKLVREAATHE